MKEISAYSRFWPAVKLAVTFLGIIVAISQFTAARQSKSLAFSLIARSLIVNSPQAGLGELEVSYRGEKIQKLESLTVRFENTGNIRINTRDFERPVKVIFGYQSQIVSAKLSDASPPGLRPKISTAANVVRIEPLMLNPKDRFALTVFVSGATGVPVVDARISGIREVTYSDRRPSRNILLARLFGIAAVMASTALYFYIAAFIWFGHRRGVMSLPLGRDSLMLEYVSLLNVIIWCVLIFDATDLFASRAFEYVGLIFLVCTLAVFLARRRVNTLSPVGAAN